MTVKRKWVLLCLAGMLLYANPAMATPFPDKTDEVIQDADGYLKQNERQSAAEAIRQLGGNYKVVVVESTQPEAQTPDEYAKKLYDNYNLPEDTLMIVLDINTQQLGVHAGPALEAKGATPDMLREKVAAYYEPFRVEKQYLQGIQAFLAEVKGELEGMKNKTGAAAGSPDAAQPSAPAAKPEEQSDAGLPWWLYGIGAVFAALSAALVYAMIRRRSIFAQVDAVEEWKDELVEKINVIEVDKPLRRSRGKTEERYMHLADRKENLLRIRIPDVEMMILDAEEACDRFRFQLALGLLAEARDMLGAIEQELDELKTDTTQVVATKKESKLAIPEIGKQVEQVERRLSDLRLEYGLSFHELKTALDEVETMRAKIKEARADGDDVLAYDITLKAQKLLGTLASDLERIPALVGRVLKEMPEEFKQLEEGIIQATGDGYDLNRDPLEGSLLQAKQLINAAKSALEEGSLDMVETHVKAFDVLIDNTYQNIENMVLSQRQAAATVSAAEPEEWEQAGGEPDGSIGHVSSDEMPIEAAAVVDRSAAPAAALADTAAAAISAAAAETASGAAALGAAALGAAGHVRTGEGEERTPAAPGRVEARREEGGVSLSASADEALTQAEREWLFDTPAALGGTKSAGVREKADDRHAGGIAVREHPAARPGENPALQAEERMAASHMEEPADQEDAEFELVIPKGHDTREEAEAEEQPVPERLVIETEDDALDELERISGTLVRLRQEIKRSYLPGIPARLKYLFEDVVQILARIKAMMEQYRYDLDEVAILINEANELLLETERLAEMTISTCQKAEGAIQYTNRYRRQNRQVDDMLTKAEQAFRQLAFDEAYQLAEAARLIVEGASEEPEKGWLLRRKKKG
jgi:septation ring formation regulator